jgi:hypothetical protein
LRSGIYSNYIKQDDPKTQLKYLGIICNNLKEFSFSIFDKKCLKSLGSKAKEKLAQIFEEKAQEQRVENEETTER